MPICLLYFLYQLNQNFHGGISLTGSDFDNAGITAVASLVLGRDLIEHFSHHVHFLGIFLLSLVACGNIRHRIEDLHHFTSCVKSGRSVLLDLFLYLIVYSYLLAVLYFFDALAVGILAGSLGGY